MWDEKLNIDKMWLLAIWVKASALIERQKSLTLSRVRHHTAPILELVKFF